MSRLRGALLTAGAILGSLCILVALASLFLGIKPLIFKSGSMSPTIPAGALALSRPVDAPDIKVGDIVSTLTRDHVRVTHRVVAMTGAGTKRLLTLRGDANPVADPQVYSVTKVDRVFWSVPWVGRLIAFFGTPVGLLLLGAACMFVLSAGFGRPRGGSHAGRGSRRPSSRRGKRRAMTAGAPLVAAAMMAPALTGTWASYADSAVVSAGMITGRVVTPVPSTTCSVSGNAVTGFTATVGWVVQTSPTTMTYTAQLREGGTLGVTTSGGNASVKVTSALLSSLLGSTVHVDIVATLPGTGWTSVAHTRALSIALLGLSLTCGADG